MLGEAVELVLGCSSCAWDEPGREAAPWALPCLAGLQPCSPPAGEPPGRSVGRPASPALELVHSAGGGNRKAGQQVSYPQGRGKGSTTQIQM